MPDTLIPLAFFFFFLAITKKNNTSCRRQLFRYASSEAKLMHIHYSPLFFMSAFYFRFLKKNHDQNVIHVIKLYPFCINCYQNI